MSQLDRSHLFALIGALEDDLRVLIETYLTSTHYEEQILGPAYARAAERFGDDPDRDVAQTTIVDYLDLGDEIAILNRWRTYLPASTQDSLQSVSAHLASLIPIRNRVAHRRPLLADDLEQAAHVLTTLESAGFEGPALKEALRRYREDPVWTPQGPAQSPDARRLNNLPLGDYDETGLIGRRRELDKLAKQLFALSSSRSPVLTVVGPGGIGKTALVLQALHDLVNDSACPFDLVSWTSLKTERLTARGIETIREAVLSIDHAVPALLEALDPTFDGSAAQLAESLDGLTALIVIDNLETVSGREVVELIDTLPETVSYLFTSREGLGEIERRFPLGPLEEKYAVDLLRRLARARGLEAFARMDQNAAEGLIRRLGASPLGLKWFISGVELGKDPEELIRHQDDLVRFCVENVYASLGAEAQSVANILHLLARPVTAQEVRLYLPALSADHLRASIQALDRRMLIRRDLVSGSIAETFEATDALSDYLRFADVVLPAEARRVRDADDAYRRAEERHKLDAASDPLRPNIVQGGTAHRASVLLLRDALSQSKRGDIDGALLKLREAETLDPEFWEIHRVRGFILSSSGPVDVATTSYLRAVELAPTAEAAAAVKYFFAGHLTRRAHESSRAVPLAREAHEVLGASRTAVELGRALTYVGEFGQAEEILVEAAQASDVRTRLIAITQLVDCMKRRAEAEAKVDRLPDVALATLATAVQHAANALEQGLVDSTLADKIVELVSDMLSVSDLCRDVLATQLALEGSLAVLAQLGPDAVRSRSFGYLRGNARGLELRRPDLAIGVPAIGVYSSADTAGSTGSGAFSAGTDVIVLGSVKAWKPDRHFGFIASLEREDDFFFGRAALVDPGSEIFLQRGATVRFRRSASSDNRPVALDVSVEEVDPDVLLSRRMIVDRLHESGSCLFANDSDSGATVFVGRHAMVSAAEWDDLDLGVEIQGRVEVDSDGRFSGASKSISIYR